VIVLPDASPHAQQDGYCPARCANARPYGELVHGALDRKNRRGLSLRRTVAINTERLPRRELVEGLGGHVRFGFRVRSSRESPACFMIVRTVPVGRSVPWKPTMVRCPVSGWA